MLKVLKISGLFLKEEFMEFTELFPLSIYKPTLTNTLGDSITGSIKD